MHQASGLAIHPFGSVNDPLCALQSHQQVNYLRGYLADLGARWVLEEPNYFDRDYLSEFSAFYSVSAAGYSNICRRLHFFSGEPLTRTDIEGAASGNLSVCESLQKRYLGFVVLRPIPQAPLGRTVLSWYPDATPLTPRVVKPSRDYSCNVAGIQLTVNGLAWQQQDTGVGACATIGLWTMFHSSAFDDHHAIPTTADITRSAHETASLGARVFPSNGLNLHQICEAIKAGNLSPLVIEGEKPLPDGRTAFSPERYSASMAALIRSGYPVLVIGELAGCGLHAICAVGFRSTGNPALSPTQSEIQDSLSPHTYAHDDNVGPNVRLKVVTGQNGEAILRMDAPVASPMRSSFNIPDINYPDLVPTRLIVGVHVDLRTSAETLYQKAITIASYVRDASNVLISAANGTPLGNIVSARFVRLHEFLKDELQQTLGTSSNPILAKVRLELIEKVRPMSLHLGLIRIGDSNSVPIMDILYDTTDSDRNHPIFANICYNSLARNAQSFLSSLPSINFDFGVGIDAF